MRVEGECTFAFSDFGSPNLEIWQMGGIEVMDRSPSTFLHPQTLDQGENAKYSFRNLIVCHIHTIKFEIQQKHCVHGWHPSQSCHSWPPQTPAPEVKLGQSFDKVIRKCIGLEQPNISSWRISFGPDFSWDAGLTFSTYLSEVNCKCFLLFLPLQRGSLFFSIARL